MRFPFNGFNKGCLKLTGPQFIDILKMREEVVDILIQNKVNEAISEDTRIKTIYCNIERVNYKKRETLVHLQEIAQDDESATGGYRFTVSLKRVVGSLKVGMGVQLTVEVSVSSAYPTGVLGCRLCLAVKEFKLDDRIQPKVSIIEPVAVVGLGENGGIFSYYCDYYKYIFDRGTVDRVMKEASIELGAILMPKEHTSTSCIEPYKILCPDNNFVFSTFKINRIRAFLSKNEVYDKIVELHIAHVQQFED